VDHDAWRQQRSFAPGAFDGVLSRSTADVAVIVPARNEEATIGHVLEPLVALRDAGLVADVAVALTGSADATGAVAADAGARVLDVGSALGKGDAVWRALEHVRGDVVCLVDADLIDVDSTWIEQLAGPLLTDPAVRLVKGAFTRPLHADGTLDETGGGRVTELLAKPLLARFYPELTALRQPLSGQIAVRRDHLAGLPIWTGYALEIGMLLDTWRAHGLDAIAEADIGVVRNRHQRLSDLAAMSEAILWCVNVHLTRDGRLSEPGGTAPIGVQERPAPARSLPA
jgi:glucosyl-3-phosphoglycerate synthase